MKVIEMNNLWVGRNETENFKVLICALDAEDAKEIANAYCTESRMSGEFEIEEFQNADTNFDCDYVLTGGQ